MAERDDVEAHPELSDWLEALLVGNLVDEWDRINWALFASKLSRPIFELTQSTALLGSWRAHDRTLSLAREAVLRRPWAETIETLKHEVAHQFVDEILGGDTSPHGPKFRQVCDARGIDGRATSAGPSPVDPSEPTPQMRVVARVQKLLALAESSNQNEAELAAATAQRIMLKYNLDLQQAGASAVTECAPMWLGEPTGRIQPHQRAMARLLLEHFFVQVIWISVYRPLEGTRGSVLEVCGRPENLAMAEYVHHFVLRTIERLWKAHKRSHRVDSDRGRRSFLAGAVAGLSQKLRAQRNVAKLEGLVWVGDAQVQAYYRRRYPRTIKVGGRASGDRAAYSEGMSAGQTIVLSRPVQGEQRRSTQRALKAGQ